VSFSRILAGLKFRHSNSMTISSRSIFSAGTTLPEPSTATSFSDTSGVSPFCALSAVGLGWRR